MKKTQKISSINNQTKQVVHNRTSSIMATKRLVRNWDKLLSLVAEPTNICIMLLIGCVVILVDGQWLLTLLNTGKDPFKWMDDEVTSASVITLRVSLCVSALHLFRSLCYRHFGRFVEYVLRTVPLKRLLLTLLLLSLCVGVMNIGYQAISFAAGLFAGRINSLFQPVVFPSRHYFTKDFLCPFHRKTLEEFLQDQSKQFIEDHPSLYINPKDQSVNFRLNPFKILEPLDDFVRPIFSTHHDRYLSEDIDLSCDLKVQLTRHTAADNIQIIIRWTKDKVIVDTAGQRVSSRPTIHNISWVFPEDKEKDSQWIAVTAPLLIRRIQGGDFGHYECHAAFVTSEHLSLLSPSSLEDVFRLFSSVVSSHELVRDTDSKLLVTLHPSARVSVEISYRMLADSDDDIFIEHKVNGVPRNELPEEDKCPSELHWPFLDFSHQQSNLFEKTEDLRKNTVVCQLHKFCVEQYHYGLHTFTLRRQFYNGDTGIQDSLEMVYGRVFVAPTLSKLFSDVKHNAYYSYLHETDCWQNNQTVVSEYCAQKLQELKTFSRLHFLLDCWATMAIYILLHVYYIWWACTLISYVLSRTLPEVFSKFGVKTMSTDAPEQSPLSSERTHRVFLAYATTEQNLSGHIKSLLEKYDLDVYDSQQDLAYGQQPLSAWDKSMITCSGFVVLLSRDYLLEPDLRFQFQTIHNMMLEERIRKNDLVLVVSGGCHIPSAIGPVPIVDLKLRHWEQMLEWWVFCFKGDFPNKTLIKQVVRDVQRDTHKFMMDNARNDDVRQVMPELSLVFGKLQSLCRPFSAGPQKEIDHTRQVNNRPERGFPASKTPVHSLCRSDSEADVSEEYSVENSIGAVGRTESGHGEAIKLAHNMYTPANHDTEGNVAALHDVFLIYCEESAWDRQVAGQIKTALEGRCSKYRLFPEGQGLRVFDAVRDVLPGQTEVHVVSEAAKSTSFVVLMSPAFVQDPITRRLHFPQVLQAVYNDAVDTENVLIVHTSGTLPHRHVPVHDGGNHDMALLKLLADICLTVMPVPSMIRERKTELEEGLWLPRWFQAFTHIHWSPCVGLCEEGSLRQWARRVRCCVKESS